MVISEGVYLKLTGYIFAVEGVVSKLGDNVRMPLPLDVVHSGRTTTKESGCSLMRVDSGTRRTLEGGVGCGEENARNIAWKSDMG